MDKYKEACGEYLVGVEKTAGGYRTLHKRHYPGAKGPRPLGTFPTEEEAIEALYNHLIANNLIEPIC